MVLKDYVGQVVKGRLITSLFANEPGKKTVWNWECPAHGPGTPAPISNLSRYGPKCCSRGPNWNGFEKISGTMLGTIRRNAKHRGIESSITPDDLWSQWLTQGGKCAYTGRQLTHGIDASVDRIDSSRGYVLDNIQWVHKDINRMKTDFTEECFLILCREVASNAKFMPQM